MKIAAVPFDKLRASYSFATHHAGSIVKLDFQGRFDILLGMRLIKDT